MTADTSRRSAVERESLLASAEDAASACMEAAASSEEHAAELASEERLPSANPANTAKAMLQRLKSRAAPRAEAEARSLLGSRCDLQEGSGPSEIATARATNEDRMCAPQDTADAPTAAFSSAAAAKEFFEAKDDLEHAAKPVTVNIKEHLAKQHLFRRNEQDAFAPGHWIRVQGLQAQSALALNGRLGQIMLPINDNGRLAVSISGFGDKLIKPDNMESLSEEETVKVARIFARGERGAGVQSSRWPTRILQERPYHLVPVSEALGLNLCITRVDPDRKIPRREDLENLLVTQLMLNPETGVAHPGWHEVAGPVIAWREDGEDLSADDVCLVVGFIGTFLSRYAKGDPPAEVQEDINFEAFEEYKRSELENDTDMCWEDVNI